MANIQLLEDHVINKIAAGEVVERPGSVVKELIENAIDAGATQITVELEEGGRKRISVFDDGMGMGREDLYMAVRRHATSKIAQIEDLFDVSSLGFRGEALASIASVSRFSMASRLRDENHGLMLSWEAGQFIAEVPWQGASSTVVTVEDLFCNIPARAKFLKSAQSEFAYSLELLESIAFARPDIALTLTHNGKEKLRVMAQSKQAGDETLETVLRRRTAELWGEETANALLYLKEGNQFGTFEALISPPGVEKATAKNLLFFVNGRWVKDKILRFGIMRGYQSHLLKGRYPQVVGHFTSDASLVDVNVHPAKTEVRFQYGGEVQGVIAQAIRKALRSGQWALGDLGALDSAEFGKNEPSQPRENHQGGQIFERAPAARGNIVKASLSYPYKPTPENRIFENHRAIPATEQRETLVLNLKETGQNESYSQIPWTALRRVGSFADCYLLFEMEERLLALDQHAFHERILYERLRANRRLLQESQPLMIPEVLMLSPEEVAQLQEKQQGLHGLGFSFEILDERCLEVGAVPSLVAGKDLSRLFTELATLAWLPAHNEPPETAHCDLLLATIACHSAVRAGEHLGEDEWRILLSEAERVDFYHNCPHGRRVFKWFEKRQVEAWFDRN